MNQTATPSPKVSPADLIAGEKALTFPLGTTLPELGHALEVAPGILWLRMALPKISTNVSVYAQEPEANALALFMHSLKKFDGLPAATLVLPSHGRPFTGLHIRTAQLLKHHEDRLDEVLEACSQQAGSAHDMLKVIFKRPLDFHQTTFAIGESVAHLHALWYAGKMKRFKDAEGIWRFQTVLN